MIERVKWFSIGAGTVLFYMFVTDVYTRLASLEMMIQVIYKALGSLAS